MNDDIYNIYGIENTLKPQYTTNENGVYVDNKIGLECVEFMNAMYCDKEMDAITESLECDINNMGNLIDAMIQEDVNFHNNIKTATELLQTTNEITQESAQEKLYEILAIESKNNPVKNIWVNLKTFGKKISDHISLSFTKNLARSKREYKKFIDEVNDNGVTSNDIISKVVKNTKDIPNTKKVKIIAASETSVVTSNNIVTVYTGVINRCLTGIKNMSSNINDLDTVEKIDSAISASKIRYTSRETVNIMYSEFWNTVKKPSSKKVPVAIVINQLQDCYSKDFTSKIDKISAKFYEKATAYISEINKYIEIDSKNDTREKSFIRAKIRLYKSYLDEIKGYVKIITDANNVLYQYSIKSYQAFYIGYKDIYNKLGLKLNKRSSYFRQYD